MSTWSFMDRSLARQVHLEAGVAPMAQITTVIEADLPRDAEAQPIAPGFTRDKRLEKT